MITLHFLRPGYRGTALSLANKCTSGIASVREWQFSHVFNGCGFVGDTTTAEHACILTPVAIKIYMKFLHSAG